MEGIHYRVKTTSQKDVIALPMIKAVAALLLADQLLQVALALFAQPGKPAVGRLGD